MFDFFFVPDSSYVEINAFPWENGERFHQVFVPVKKKYLPSSFVVPTTKETCLSVTYCKNAFNPSQKSILHFVFKGLCS